MDLLQELLRSALLASIPVLLAALGGLYTYHSNVFNIAMEGMMLIAAFAAVLGSYAGASWMLGMLLGITSSCLLAFLFIFFVVILRTDEFVTGIAINILALGGTTYALRQMFDVKGAFISPKIIGLPRISLPVIAQIPFIGEILSDLPFLVYIAIVLVWMVHFHLYNTKFGLRLRATGVSAVAVESVGIHVSRIKRKAIIFSGALCGLAGVFLSLGYVTLFVENMTNGRGWVSLAVIILTKGKPVAVLLMSLLFGFFDALGLSLQRFSIPSQFTQMAPYLATIIALYFYSNRDKKNSS